MRQLIIIIALIFPFTVNADVKLSPQLECCIETNSKLEHQISNQGIIIKELKSIHKDLTLKNDTLIHSLKIAVEAKTEKEEKTGFDFFSFLGAILGAVISGGAAILVFYLTKRNDRKKESKRLIDFGEQIFELLKNIIENAIKQRELIEAYLKSIKDKPHTHGEYRRMSLNLYQRAKSFDTTIVFNSFKELKLERNSYIKYYNTLDFMYGFFSLTYDDYQMHNSEIVTPLSNEFLKLRTVILDNVSIQLKTFKENGEDKNDFYIFFDKLLKDYYNTETRPKSIDISYDVKMIIKPLKEELIKENYAKYTLTNELLMNAKRAGDYYQTILDQASALETTISNKINSINNSIAKLEGIKDKLSNKYAS